MVVAEAVTLVVVVVGRGVVVEVARVMVVVGVAAVVVAQLLKQQAPAPVPA